MEPSSVTSEATIGSTAVAIDGAREYTTDLIVKTSALSCVSGESTMIQIFICFIKEHIKELNAYIEKENDNTFDDLAFYSFIRHHYHAYGNCGSRKCHIKHIRTVFALFASGVVYYICPDRCSRKRNNDRNGVKQIHKIRFYSDCISYDQICCAECELLDTVDQKIHTYSADGISRNLFKRHISARHRMIPINLSIGNKLLYFIGIHNNIPLISLYLIYYNIIAQFKLFSK